ncbi:hypothetical protein RRG08_018989 [Elysia crispata]|uniref:Uncharacterized protein n=1 Tax=Elysia crispata TaxID=231223 RepID=A0AAE1DTS7_9GAST|nr:hypothetical protein RRG08_018989 [Elysia crispata]
MDRRIQVLELFSRWRMDGSIQEVLQYSRAVQHGGMRSSVENGWIDPRSAAVFTSRSARRNEEFGGEWMDRSKKCCSIHEPFSTEE